MDKQTLKALKGSIAKWWGIRYAGGVDEGTDNCPLCKLFWRDGCTGCPVALAVNATVCRGTPYVDFVKAAINSHGLQVKSYNDAALAEFEFLVSLLPPGETWESPDGWTYYND